MAAEDEQPAHLLPAPLRPSHPPRSLPLLLPARPRTHSPPPRLNDDCLVGHWLGRGGGVWRPWPSDGAPLPLRPCRGVRAARSLRQAPRVPASTPCARPRSFPLGSVVAAYPRGEWRRDGVRRPCVHGLAADVAAIAAVPARAGLVGVVIGPMGCERNDTMLLAAGSGWGAGVRGRGVCGRRVGGGGRGAPVRARMHCTRVGSAPCPRYSDPPRSQQAAPHCSPSPPSPIIPLDACPCAPPFPPPHAHLLSVDAPPWRCGTAAVPPWPYRAWRVERGGGGCPRTHTRPPPPHAPG